MEKILGQGESGRSYLGRDQRAEQSPVVLRTPTGWNDGLDSVPLQQQLSFLSRFRHPNFSHLLDFGILQDTSSPYLVRPYVEGVDCFSGSENWSVDQVLHHLVKLCRVLQFLHARNIVHCHLKPSNVILTEIQEDTAEPKVMDPRLARGTQGKRRDHDALVYAAPEILMGHHPNSASDLYSLGILAYQLLTRRLPFEDDNRGFFIQKLLQGKVDMRPIERSRGGAGLAQVLRGLLEKNPGNRPSSAEDVILLLSAASGRSFSGDVPGLTEAYFSAGRFVGRETEMACLRDRAARVRDGSSGWTVFLTGEAGAGKTRCLEEFRSWALLEGWRVEEASCHPREERSYALYRRLLECAAVSQRPCSKGILRDDRTAGFEDGLPAPEVSYDLSAGDAAGPFRDLLTREIVALLADRPTVLLLHDFHWADESTVAILDYLVADIRAHPVFLCVSLRLGEVEHGPLARLVEAAARQLRAETLPLHPLSAQAVEQLVTSITGEALLGKDIGSRIQESSGGNPFFVEEMLKHFVDRGFLRREFGAWRLAPGGFEMREVPCSVAAVLRHRLARLSPRAAALTPWLALLRRAVPGDLLQALSAMDGEKLLAGLQELISRQIIREVSAGAGKAYEFRHTLISEVIIQDMPGRRRRRMHRRIGEVLEQQRGGQETLQELAIHFMEGNGGRQAIEYALRAARLCRQEFCHEAALRFYDYLLRNPISLVPEQLCQVSVEAADVCCALGNPKRAIRILQSRLRTRNPRVRSLTRVQLLTQLSRSYQFFGDMERSELAAKRGLRILKKVKTPDRDTAETLLLSQLAFCMLAKSQPGSGLAILQRSSCVKSQSQRNIAAGHLYILISGLCWVKCDFIEGSKTSRRAILILESLNANHLLPMAHSHLGLSLAGLGKLGKALEQHEKAVATARRTRSRFLLAQALCNLTEGYCRSGQFALALDHSAQTVAAASETENRNLAIAGVLSLLEVQITTADWAGALQSRARLTARDFEALPVYQRALALLLSATLSVELGSADSALSDLDALDGLVSAETPIHEASLGQILRARILYLQGRVSEAMEVLFRLEALLTKRRWAYHSTRTRLQLAEVLLAAGDRPAARSRARHALRLARAMPSRHLQVQAHVLLGWIALLEAESLPADASTTLRESVLSAALRELDAALAQVDGIHMADIARRAHHGMARYGRLIHDVDRILAHAREALRLLGVIEARVPADMVEAFRKAGDRERARSDCQLLIRESGNQPADEAVAIGEIEEEHLRMLFRVGNAIHAIRDPEELMTQVAGLLADAVGAERVFIALQEQGTETLRLAGKRNLAVSGLDELEPVIHRVLGQVVRSRSPFVTANAAEDSRLAEGARGGAASGCIFCAPLVARGQTLGILYADHPLRRDGLRESTINLFAAFCSIAAVAIDNALTHHHLVKEKTELEQYLRQASHGYPEMVGRSPAMQDLRERISLAAASPLDVLIIGESGTGKELVARALHRTGRRCAGRFLPLDCGSLSDTLVESELFGYRKGAFTGAAENRAGLFEAADGGVIFLDEISNLSMRLQRKLLRVLQEREVRRIGDTSCRKINVQVIAATNRDLRAETRAGRFREDLYFRLRTMEIRVPPLRARTRDISLLLEWFLDQTATNEGGRSKAFSQEAHALLLRYPYPGNVRELKNIVEASYFSTPGDIIEFRHLPAEVREIQGNAAGDSAAAAWDAYRRILDGRGTFEELIKKPFQERKIGSGSVRQLIHLALSETAGRYRDALRLLGISSREYAATIQYLKRNGCYLDFRPYRRPGSGRER